MHFRKRILAAVMLSCCLVSCANADSSSDISQSEPETVQACTSERSVRDKALDDYLALIDATDRCAHALGSIDGHIYTNSLDALWRSYEGGARLFEADIHLTSDGQAVLVHGFAKNDYLKRIGEEYYPDKYKKTGEDYYPTHDEFMSWRIQGRYQPLDFAMLGCFIKAHPDIFVLADVWAQDYDSTKAVYTAMCEACGYDELVLSHIIAGGHTQDMIRAVKDVYDFPILNLYYSDEMINDDFTAQDFADYCKSQGIQSYSCSDEYCTVDNYGLLEDSGLISYVFTVDDKERASKLLACGVDIVGANDIL